MIEINKEEYYKQYKNIYHTCADNGEIFPNTLTNIIIPYEYRFTTKEKQDIDNNISPENKKKITDKLITRRKDEIQILYDKDYEKMIDKYNDKELTDFLNKHSEFKTIIKSPES